jgi:hypothetical protein
MIEDAGLSTACLGGIETFVQTGKSIPDLDILPQGSGRVKQVAENDISGPDPTSGSRCTPPADFGEPWRSSRRVILEPNVQGNRHELDYPNTSLAAHFGAPR